MRTAKLVMSLMCAATLVGGAASQAEAKPGGCLKYGAAGAVAGHYAGHHAVKGAVAGCIAGMARRHEYNKHLKEQKELEEKQKQEQHDAAPATQTSAPAAQTPPASTDQGQTPPPASTDQK